MPPPRPPKPPPPRPPKPPPPPPAAGAYRGTTMLVHFRETPYGLAMSLVESRRENGKVRHDFVASLGSLETPPSVTARVEFWRGLHERLDQLSNRLDAETRGKVIGAVHSRVPMVTSDEQRALQLEAKGDAGQWPPDFLSRRVGLAPSKFSTRAITSLPRAVHLHVRFAPKATEVLHCRELTRCATSGHAPSARWRC